MSEEIIKVLDNICDKIGIAVDWSAENVWPYALEVLKRYRIMELINCAILLIFCMALIAVIAFLCKKSARGYMNEVSPWYEDGLPSPFSIIIWIVGGIIGLVMIVGVFNQFSHLLQWALVPEIKYLNMLLKYV